MICRGDGLKSVGIFVIGLPQRLMNMKNLLLIKHSGGLITAYAHANKLLVGRGDLVSRGQVVARVGKTGGIDVPQLHFEIRRGSEAVDPRKFLPS